MRWSARWKKEKTHTHTHTHTNAFYVVYTSLYIYKPRGIGGGGVKFKSFLKSSRIESNQKLLNVWSDTGAACMKMVEMMGGLFFMGFVSSSSISSPLLTSPRLISRIRISTVDTYIYTPFPLELPLLPGGSDWRAWLQAGEGGWADGSGDCSGKCRVWKTAWELWYFLCSPGSTFHAAVCVGWMVARWVGRCLVYSTITTTTTTTITTAITTTTHLPLIPTATLPPISTSFSNHPPSPLDLLSMLVIPAPWPTSGPEQK